MKTQPIKQNVMGRFIIKGQSAGTFPRTQGRNAGGWWPRGSCTRGARGMQGNAAVPGEHQLSPAWLFGDCGCRGTRPCPASIGWAQPGSSHSTHGATSPSWSLEDTHSKQGKKISPILGDNSEGRLDFLTARDIGTPFALRVPAGRCLAYGNETHVFEKTKMSRQQYLN